MKILFLHGWHSAPGGVKPTHLASHGHEVLNPALDDDDFAEAVRAAQAEYDRHHPDVVVGSSRGGAVAMNLRSGTTPMVLLCPAWRRWGSAATVKPGTTILHAEADDVIPILDSRDLVQASGLPEASLVVVGADHRLADPEPLARMLEACRRAASPVSFRETIPLLRIFDVARAHEFYVGFLGFAVDWEHRFDAAAPAYMQVSRGGLRLHLTGHHGDACPGSTVFVWMDGIDAYHREITSQGYGSLRPGIEETFYNARMLEVIDPFGNRIRFHERGKPAAGG